MFLYLNCILVGLLQVHTGWENFVEGVKRVFVEDLKVLLEILEDATRQLLALTVVLDGDEQPELQREGFMEVFNEGSYELELVSLDELVADSESD